MHVHEKSTGKGNITIEVHLDQDATEVLQGIRRDLLRTPRILSPQFFYDEHGSELFERITESPEYYQTRTERALLESVADEVVAQSGVQELVELGSGASTKTRVLLDAMTRAERLQAYVPFDVSESMLRRVADELVAEYDRLKVHGVVGEFTKHLEEIPHSGRRLIIFLGGTIGNFEPMQARRFLSRVSDTMEPGEYFLLGTDIIKDSPIIEAAYNDSQGVTADFNRNILQVINNICNGNFDVQGFEHRAFYNEERERVEMWLVCSQPQEVRLDSLSLLIAFEPGDRIRTEISIKFNREKVRRLLEACGLCMERWYTDSRGLFALSLARRVDRKCA